MLIPAAIGLLLSFSTSVFAADCRVAVVGQPHSSCWDIATAAGISVAQLQSFNNNLDCGLIFPGQRLCTSAGTLPNISPVPNPDGSCARHTVAAGTWCALIAEQYHITTDQIETFNRNTYKWKGCASLQVGAVICVSSGTPPPIPINPDLHCGPESQGNKTCPLNVCCSAFGFCGQTDEFCNAAPNGDPCISNCGQPTLARCNGGQMRRKIGYYAGWGARRTCQPFKPENLNLEGYTGVIFAFATISQSNEITLDSNDVPILRNLVAHKERFPGLEVTIAVGGWAFSMDDPTKTIFSQMISTSANRAKFINSVRTFMSTYNLDGIDIDMEYPAAMERSAPAEDTPNLTALFREMRAAFGTKVISVATPAGYWFLKGFEIDKLAPFTTYINMMSYDYHGAWDLHVDGEDGKAKPHTSVSDIMDSIRLYTRAKIDFNKVNLGLAWYGRTYAVGGCRGTNCLMSGGGAPGPCTGESSIKSQLEIWNELQADGITPTRDTASQTYWYNKGNDFISFDDEATWNHKTQIAKDYCFGGTFIWSLDLGRPSDPPPPEPEYEVGCTHSMSNEQLGYCRQMINDIFDTNQYNLGDQSKRCNAPVSAQNIMCFHDCCLYIASDVFPNVTIRAKEVKEAALSILDRCHSPGANRRSLQRRLIPLAALLPWLASAFAGTAPHILRIAVGAFLMLFESFGTLFTDGDDEPRGEFVQETVANLQQQYPEYNVMVVHTDHEPNFQEPCYHKHMEWDRPFPFPGTFGYEVYLMRKGKFLLKGDGGFINWAYSGVVSENPNNRKDLTFSPPGAAYGNAAPVMGKYVQNGQTKSIDIAVGIGGPTGCASTFNLNHDGEQPTIRCIDVD